jgi:hypothetical protein
MKNTLNAFIKSSSIDAKLIRAVVRQLGDWENFTNYAPDVATTARMLAFPVLLTTTKQALSMQAIAP